MVPWLNVSFGLFPRTSWCIPMLYSHCSNVLASFQHWPNHSLIPRNKQSGTHKLCIVGNWNGRHSHHHVIYIHRINSARRNSRDLFVRKRVQSVSVFGIIICSPSCSTSGTGGWLDEKRNVQHEGVAETRYGAPYRTHTRIHTLDKVQVRFGTNVNPNLKGNQSFTMVHRSPQR